MKPMSSRKKGKCGRDLHRAARRADQAAGRVPVPDDDAIEVAAVAVSLPPSWRWRARVRDGKMRMPLLPVLYELPDRLARDGGWRDRRYWPLVNPNLGRSTNEDFLAREVMRADADGPAAVALIASQHFNVQIGMSLRADGWAGAQLLEPRRRGGADAGCGACALGSGGRRHRRRRA